MKRRFNSHNISFLKFFDQRNMGSLPRIFLSSLLVVFFFYCVPIFSNIISLDIKNLLDKSYEKPATYGQDGRRVSVNFKKTY